MQLKRLMKHAAWIVGAVITAAGLFVVFENDRWTVPAALARAKQECRSSLPASTGVCERVYDMEPMLFTFRVVFSCSDGEDVVVSLAARWRIYIVPLSWREDQFDVAGIYINPHVVENPCE